MMAGKTWDELWGEKDNYSWWSDPRVNSGDPDDPEVWLSMIKTEGDKLNNKFEAIKKTHDRIIDWILHHEAESEKATHWTDEWKHDLPESAFRRVLNWIRKDLGLPPLEPLHNLSIEDKILEAS